MLLRRVIFTFRGLAGLKGAGCGVVPHGQLADLDTFPVEQVGVDRAAPGEGFRGSEVQRSASAPDGAEHVGAVAAAFDESHGGAGNVVGDPVFEPVAVAARVANVYMDARRSDVLGGFEFAERARAGQRLDRPGAALRVLQENEQLIRVRRERGDELVLDAGDLFWGRGGRVALAAGTGDAGRPGCPRWR